MAAVLKVLGQIESPTPSIARYLHEEQSYHISSRSDVKRRSRVLLLLLLFVRATLFKKA